MRFLLPLFGTIFVVGWMVGFAGCSAAVNPVPTRMPPPTVNSEAVQRGQTDRARIDAQQEQFRIAATATGVAFAATVQAAPQATAVALEAAVESTAVAVAQATSQAHADQIALQFETARAAEDGRTTRTVVGWVVGGLFGLAILALVAFVAYRYFRLRETEVKAASGGGWHVLDRPELGVQDTALVQLPQDFAEWQQAAAERNQSLVVEYGFVVLRDLASGEVLHRVPLSRFSGGAVSRGGQAYG